MNPYYPNLFSPLRVGSVILKNRMEVAPMAPAWLGANVEHYRHDLARFERYAMGGAGLVTVGEVSTDDMGGRSGPRELVITHPNYKTYLHELADIITAHGAAASIEVSHAGMKAKAANNNGVTAILEQGVMVSVNGEEKLIPADTVILSVGYTPKTEEAAAYLDTCGFVRRIGDCNTPGKISLAIRYGYFAAMAI